ncbi:MAG TPA: alpha/beta fold hydrolase [Luteimonas sp.]|nr:alpha/beta fold hydrolase [Luteimonas sp.]HRO26383.1 alpha/beta fold hydrolase [Luteimonas sp.]HRP71564.1 alpha/beta fold hydrolase [Luteimonas sp.]
MRALLALLLVHALAGCALLREFSPAVVMQPMTQGEYIALQRGDLLTSGELSALTAQTLRVAGLEPATCAADSAACRQVIGDARGIIEERRLSALSELWLQRSLALQADAAAGEDARLQALMESARHAYGYLFFTARTPGERAFEDRQTQVRDWYNYAVQEASTLLFEHDARERGDLPDAGLAVDRLQHGGWTFVIDLSGMRRPRAESVPLELLPASSLSFEGLRNTWRRDGFGAELVAVMHDDPMTVQRDPALDATDAAPAGREGRRGRRPPVWSEMPSPGITVLFHFDGSDLEAVLATREVRISAHDPYADDSVELRGQRVPLAANFSAGYGLWLARSGFNRQSLRTLFGREQGIDRPHLYMMHRWDPQRRIILMLHGLASSPEAWVNVANEIQGDEVLRREFQVWQVYYPTNMPVALNHAAIRRLLARTLRHFDPEGSAPASRDMVLVGHSMGGLIGRLMVSSADDELWAWAEAGAASEPERFERMRPRMDAILRFEPVEGIRRAVFIATPHRGTTLAGDRLGRWLSRLVRLPLTVLENFGEILQLVPDAHAAGSGDASPLALPNSIDNLDRNDPFVRAAADLRLSGRVRTHSIIARLDPAVALEDSDDGLVPYPSAHLPGALSEKVITSGHSVQETALAILELRRILHQDVDEHRARASSAAPDP